MTRQARHMIRVLLGGLAACVLLSGVARATEMAFYIRNGVDRAVALELHGDGNHVWPGGDKVFMIEGGAKKSVPVDCEAGERICYGAWLAGDDRTSWGVGPDNTRDCDDCCTQCTAKSTYTIDLKP